MESKWEKWIDKEGKKRYYLRLMVGISHPSTNGRGGNAGRRGRGYDRPLTFTIGEIFDRQKNYLWRSRKTS